eukprot:Unigene1437_Nuclearia_a/m.4524 Unigene1437_Nuclearia_a/g.4524  ORF Unigene1437_Nuclearia_a/g.4524 Unigene1437_Nuclearia_a/m.4524 type:complete len:658 (+) Unigene1437_Nuclearia_a:206-2179(+)
MSTDEEMSRLSLKQLEPVGGNKARPQTQPVVRSPLATVAESASARTSSDSAAVEEAAEQSSGAEGQQKRPFPQLQIDVTVTEKTVISPLFKGVPTGTPPGATVINPLYRQASLMETEEFPDMPGAGAAGAVDGQPTRYRHARTMPRKMDWRMVASAPPESPTGDSGAQISRFGSRRLSRGALALRQATQSSSSVSSSSPPPQPVKSPVNFAISQVSAETFDKLASGQIVRLNEGGRDFLVLEKVDRRMEVIAADIENMVEQLANENEQDMEFVDMVLLTHSQFMTSEDLLEQLISRFYMELDSEPSKEDLLYFEMHQRDIQLRVLNVLARWVKNHVADFDVNEDLREVLVSFLDDIKSNGFQTEAERVVRTLSQQMSRNASLVRRSSLSNGTRITQPPPALAEATAFLTMDPLLLTRQLVRMDQVFYRNISGSDFFRYLVMSSRMRRTSSKDGAAQGDKDEVSSVSRFLSRSDQIRNWAAYEVVSLARIKARRIAVTKLIRVAKMCRDYNDFCATFSIVSGLYLPPVKRLKKTWEGVSGKDMQVLQSLDKLMDPMSNMKVYREVLDRSRPPMVPFFPIATRELLYIHERNETIVDDLVNLKKLKMITSMIQRYVSLHSQPYPFDAQPAVSGPLEERISAAPAEGVLLRLSHMVTDEV